MYEDEVKAQAPLSTTLKGLVDGGTLDAGQAARLADYVNVRRTLLIFGDRATGKSTLLNALLELISVDERFVSIEQHDHLPALEERSFCVRLSVDDDTDLDSLFTMTLDEKHFAETEDVTRVGIIGNYVHGNEPSHHVPYLYDWTSKPWKTQEKIHMINRMMYRNAPDGLCGNDDCGQMSAWYIFSTLGFYPVCPGTTQYAIGSPCVKEATVSLPNGKTLVIKAPGLSEKNIYIKSVTLNGKPVSTMFLEHSDLMNGGELLFEMAPSHKR